jgi:hypothetical protein
MITFSEALAIVTKINYFNLYAAGVRIDQKIYTSFSANLGGG